MSMMQRFADFTAASMLNDVKQGPDAAAMAATFGAPEDWMLTPLELRTVLELTPCTHWRKRGAPVCEKCFVAAAYHALIRKMALRLGTTEEDAEALAAEMAPPL